MSQASVLTGISQSSGFGSNIDLTAGSFVTWGYDADSLIDGFSNFKSGTTVATVSNPNTSSTRNYGYTFTFNDGNNPALGTMVTSSGGLAGLLNTGPSIAFSGIVSSTETRRLTLYVGGYHSAGSARVTLTFDATLTGGISDETGTAQSFVVDSTTSDAVGFVEGYAVATYTVEFTSATETDLVITVNYSNASGTRNWGLCGYTVETVSGGTPPPAAPTGLTATPGNGSVSLDWSDNAGSNLTYSVYRSTNSGNYGSALTNGLVSSETVDSTAVNFTTYYYVVTAVDTNGAESALSSEVSVTPADPSNQTPVFTSDPIVAANAQEGAAYSATIADHASDPESDPMTFSKVDGPDWLRVASDGGLSGTPASTNTGLNVFTIQVSAAGGSDTATLQITVDADTTAPAVPTGLSATAGYNSVTLDWNENTEDDLAGYSVYRSTVSSNYTTALVSNLTSSAYVDRTAVNDTTYYYSVSASDGSGNESSKSSEVSATPDASALQPLVWLDASQGVGLEAGKVAVWTNLASPGTFNAVQADPSKRPVMLYEEWSGHPLVYFDGAGDLLTLDGSVSNALFEGEMTVFFVGRRRTGGGFKPGGILGNFQTGYGDKGWALNVLDTGVYQFRLPGTSVDGGAATLSQDYVVMSARYEDIGGDTGRMEIAGTLNEDPVSKNNTPFAIASSSVDIAIGMYCGFKSYTFNQSVEMDVAEIRIYGSALSDTNRQAIYDELTAKYSLAAKEWYNVVDFQPDGYSAAADSTIEITFDVPMDADSITNIIVGAGGLDGLAEQTDWQVVTGQWAASVSNTVFTFTPDAPFDAGELVMCEIPTNVASAAGGVNESVTDRELFSFVVDTGKTYSYQRTVLNPMAVVPNEYVDEFGVTNVVDHNLPMTLHIPDTPEPCPVMFWVHGGTFNGGNTGTLTASATEDAQKGEYFAEKLGIASIGVAWRSTLSEGTFTKATNDIATAIRYVMNNAVTLGIDTSRMGIYGGSAGTPMSSLVSQIDTNMICYIGFNGSYDFVDDGYGAGSTGFGQDDPSWAANSAIYNIRTNPPATLLLHGSDDTIIPNAESLDYEAALQAAGGDAETLIYRGYGHAFYKGADMNYPTMVACSRFLSRIFGLGVYDPLTGYAQWAAGWNADIGAVSNDFDADGLNNLYEYGLGGNPTNALDQGTLPTFTKEGALFIYVHPKRSGDETITYTVETTTNLVSGVWTNQRYTVTGTNVTEGTVNFVTNEVGMADSEKFIRLKIEQ
jgi:acetyl esterase/lipase/fibronectin type 3 domain-containing protein